MPIFRASNILECPGHGCRETWFFQMVSNSTLDQAFAAWLPTVEPRRLLLGREAQFKAVELSIELDDAGQPVKGDSLISYVYKNGYSLEDLADRNICLLIKAQTAGRMRRRNQYLRFIWDSIEIEGGQYVVPQNSTWQTKINSWKQAMLGVGVGYMQSTRGDQFPLTTYVQNEDGTVTMNFTGNIFTTQQVGKKLTIRVYTARTKSQLTGQQVVVPTSQTACKTVNRIAVLQQPTTGWTGSLYTYAFATTPFLDEQKVVEHLIGRPLLESVGRRPARARI